MTIARQSDLSRSPHRPNRQFDKLAGAVRLQLVAASSVQLASAMGKRPPTGRAWRSLYIGLMSGTSLDGVDGVLADFSGPGVRVLAAAGPFTPALAVSAGLNTRARRTAPRRAGGQCAGSCLCEVVQACWQRPAPGEARAIGAHDRRCGTAPGRLTARLPHCTIQTTLRCWPNARHRRGGDFAAAMALAGRAPGGA